MKNKLYLYWLKAFWSLVIPTSTIIFISLLKVFYTKQFKCKQNFRLKPIIKTKNKNSFSKPISHFSFTIVILTMCFLQLCYTTNYYTPGKRKSANKNEFSLSILYYIHNIWKQLFLYISKRISIVLQTEYVLEIAEHNIKPVRLR